MIVYSFIEELKIIIYLLAYSISVISIYDLLIMSSNKKIVVKLIYQLLYSIMIIFLTQKFIYKLQKGFIPQYSTLILIGSMLIYFLFIKKTFNHIIKLYRHFLNKIQKILKKVFSPFRILKTTILQFKKKKIRNNNQNTLQK